MLLLAACSSQKPQPTPPPSPATPQIQPQDLEKDLGIGLSPTPPKNEKIPGEKSRAMLRDAANKNTPVIPPDANLRIDKRLSNPLSIMSSSGGILTVWALAKGNWIWGYTPLDAHEFGNANSWRIVTLETGESIIQNRLTTTCLEAYRNGVIHESCDGANKAQLWRFNFFENQAIQIQNIATKTCLQTPTARTTTYYSIFLVPCATKEPNLDQQWYITPSVGDKSPIFVINEINEGGAK